MGILIKNIRVNNYRSLENVELELEEINILIGQNNVGKSNLMKALDMAFNGSRIISEDDIYVKEGEHLTKGKKAIIDIKICPIEDGEIKKDFSDFWTGVFTDRWIITDEINGSYVGIRTIIEYDIKKNDYIVIRKPIIEWNDSIEESKTGRKQLFTSDMHDFINHFYMDAHRDVTEDIRNRKSYFGRATSRVDLDEKKVEELEEKLNSVNLEIVSKIAAINETKVNLSKIGKTLGNTKSVVQIEPLSRKISDLHKGMDITFKDGNAATFSVAQHGMGTRSWISFLTLGAYVDFFHKSIKKEEEEADDLVILSLEEPEAHLHPQAQRQIYQQLIEFKGQKIVSTHATSILAQADLKNIVQLKKKDGKTYVNRFNIENYSTEEIEKIEREVIKTHGELIFSNIIVLCEGITEEQALPIYFKEFFGIDPTYMGINIIGIGGQNYKSYMKFIKEFDINWYVFSDGEKGVIQCVKNAVKKVFDKDYSMLNNVFIIENEFDIEKMLIKHGVVKQIIAAINKANEQEDFYDKYLTKLNGDVKTHRKKTDKPPCETCGQYIYEDIIDEDENGLTNEETKLYRCMISKNGKAKYATYIAKEIVKNPDITKRFPLIILRLLMRIEKDFEIGRSEEYNGLKIIGETIRNS